MKPKLPMFLREFLSYSRAERVGVVALLFILIVIIFIPSFLPKHGLSENNIDELKSRVNSFEQKIAESSKIKLFDFDPNIADSLMFYELGFSPAQTEVILHYRKKGGVFRTVDDFGKVYVISDSVFHLLKPFIVIQTKLANTTKPKIIELNIADAVTLKQLHGIGDYYAQKIIDRRDKLGGFVNVEQLLEVYGIDEERLLLFKNRVAIDTTLVQKINLNTITATDLRKHPYFDVPITSAIIRLRKAQGQINSLNELVEKNIITQRQAEKVKNYVIF